MICLNSKFVILKNFNVITRSSFFYTLFKSLKNGFYIFAFHFLVLYFTFTISILHATELKPIEVTFISVASANDEFWQRVHYIGKQAAEDLNINLNIIYSQRSHIDAINHAKEITMQRDKPDYVIVVGEKLVASKSIPILDAKGIKTFLFGSLTPEEQMAIGVPRSQYKSFIGQRAIDDYKAGFMTANSLFKEAIRARLFNDEGIINLIVLEGARETSFNLERVRGMKDALKQYPEIHLMQSLHTNWTYEDGERLTRQALIRYEKERRPSIIWCANTAIALGASAVMENQGFLPNKDYVVGGTDWNSEMFKALKSGKLYNAAGGHIAELAWILVMLHDFHHGIDFGIQISYSNVNLIEHNDKTEKYTLYYDNIRWQNVDFRQFSKVFNPRVEHYNFNVMDILPKFTKLPNVSTCKNNC